MNGIEQGLQGWWMLEGEGGSLSMQYDDVPFAVSSMIPPNQQLELIQADMEQLQLLPPPPLHDFQSFEHIEAEVPFDPREDVPPLPTLLGVDWSNISAEFDETVDLNVDGTIGGLSAFYLEPVAGAMDDGAADDGVGVGSDVALGAEASSNVAAQGNESTELASRKRKRSS
ncbi:uncharacterized protein LOC143889454 [Tasmannia lanceolata]|uniref:uncharacterized protein LOC143889454 n=1 Tax=Tasmannia lanceolata TaxID=3420 RepID=UPI0040635C30